ncbi:MAG TPA: Calx-beta domain-containing protein [Thermoanaerobaculia bacterium]|nr:Calx-beta domain-containing protein [Thermoanaerobaculia bacterium]
MSLRRTAVLCATVLLLVLASAPAAYAITADVQVGGSGLVYTPSVVTIHVGDTVRWTNAGGFHNAHADDGSFQCSDSCNNGSNGPSGNAWSFTHTFNTAGTFLYHCDQHGAPGGAGMSGQVVVQAAPPPPEHGAFRFSPASYNVSESVGHVTVHVTRTGGDDGAVSVDFATTAGTASAGSDFTTTSGTLNWADHDSDDKTFDVTIVNDSVQESNELLNLGLSNPTGGATVADGHGSITIVDDDAPSGGGTPPAAPSNLAAAAQSTSEVLLTWKDNASGTSNETSFRIESKGLTTPYQQVQTAAQNATSALVPSLDPATAYTFRVRANNAAGNSAYSNEASATTHAEIAACVAGANTLCVGAGGRFKLEVAWKSANASGQGVAVPVASAPQSGLFYFVDPSNIEMLVKVLNACIPALGNKYWVFYAATTNVQFTLTITDTHTGLVKVYFNPLNQAAAPVQDTNAFATCP